MAEDIRHFTATLPAGAGSFTVSTISLAMPVRVVRRVDWRVPHGPMGTMGWVLAMGGVPVLPTSNYDWVIADGETGYWEVDGYPDSGAWQLQGYNSGANLHSVYLTFHCQFPARPRAARPLLSPLDVSSAPDLSRAGPPLAGR